MAEPPIAIRPEHWDLVAGILHRVVPGREVWAFRSRARGKSKPYSDLDLAVIGGSPMSLGLSAALAEAFSESDLPFRVDVVDWATTSASFRKIIEQTRWSCRLPHARRAGIRAISSREQMACGGAYCCPGPSQRATRAA